jgi:membrane-bound lytic murein transglycosylase F
MHYSKLLSLVLVGLILVSSLSCTDNVDKIKQRGELIVVTRNAPTTYYEARDGLAGVEYELASSFAEAMKVKLRFIVKDSLEDIFRAIEKNEADFAAAGLTKTAQRTNGFLFSDSYQEVQQQLVCRRGGARPKKVSDLTDINLVIPAKSSYSEQLAKLKKEHPELSWREDSEKDTEELLDMVWQRKLDCTVADSNIVAINRRYFPELVVRFNLTEPEPLGWLLHKDNTDLKHRINAWLTAHKFSGKLSQVIEKYYGFIEVFDYVDNRHYQRAIKKRLPAFKKLFQKHAKKHDLPWTLLAAQSYQESHWRARAKSPTGVRGIMMLTQATARELNISNRLDPVQSIKGGAKYLSRLIHRIPEDVKQPDRTWFALAAYNIGMGHLYDARKLARNLGKNPSLWSDLEQVFPLLTQKKYYRHLKHGYARGSEPVRYVQRIRDYQDILERNSSF